MILEAYSQLIRDPNHWAFELTLIFLFDILIGLVVWPFIDRHLHDGDDGEHRHINHFEDETSAFIDGILERIEALETAAKGFVTPKLGDLCTACKHPLVDNLEGQESCAFLSREEGYCHCACWQVLRGGSPVIT